MTTGKNICVLNLENLSKYEDLIKKYCEENDIHKLKKVPASGSTIYYVRILDGDKNERTEIL